MSTIIGKFNLLFNSFDPSHLENSCPVCCATKGRRCVNKFGVVLEATSHRERVHNKKAEYVKGAKPL